MGVCHVIGQMFIRSFLAKQLGYPTGIFGRLLMRLLNSDNATMNDLTLEQIALQPGDRILEIGFGGGYLIEQMATTKIPSFIAGVDSAIDVIQMSSKKFQSQIERGYIELKQASAESLPYGDKFFNNICTVNTIYFWSNIQLVLAECDRLLQPQGKLVICYNSPAFLTQTKLTEHGFIAYEPQELESLMANAGFIHISTILADGGNGNGIFYCTCGIKAN